MNADRRFREESFPVKEVSQISAKEKYSPWACQHAAHLVGAQSVGSQPHHRIRRALAGV